ncbi:hypothetical protein Vadar_024584 [Vaccinium darrowii]|uniref:Uncharacterized protein n=1 Tax=Vaccinium darrowii TaxID=229202 RepID=A0ACB7XK40_9ERIC|nr:hypothetical protein Vadar_024584 [Vaccinium darrowii]
MANRRSSSQPNSSAQGCGNDYLNKELWKLCAGPRVEIPRVGEKVFYFPQGSHGTSKLEASTNQEQNPGIHLDLNTATKDLPPSKILCSVMNIQLLAGNDLEVYMQISLVPEQDQSEPTSPESYPPEPSTPIGYSFCKVLTPSDAGSHGGFIVLKKHAECFPELDKNQEPPMQDLITKDLHGDIWQFRHVFKGKPKRHKLTTGWSKFVKEKKIVAGDSFVFLRGENGEMRVGLRRFAHQQCSMPSSQIPSESIPQVVLGAASSALATGTRFAVLIKPRMSQFVIGFNKYQEAVSNSFAVGMKFKMRFDGEDSLEKKFTGTIVGVEDLSSQWENSKWRSLRVRWDEAASIARPERVSPWEIEPFPPNNRAQPPCPSTGAPLVRRHR